MGDFLHKSLLRQPGDRLRCRRRCHAEDCGDGPDVALFGPSYCLECVDLGKEERRLHAKLAGHILNDVRLIQGPHPDAVKIAKFG